MKKIIWFIPILAIVLLGCSKISTNTIVETEQVSAFKENKESHLESESKSVYNYARYAKIDDAYEGAYKDYMCYLNGSYPVSAKLAEDFDKDICRVWNGNGYSITVEFHDDNKFFWEWKDEKIKTAVLKSLEEGKKEYERVVAEDEKLYKKYEDEVFEDSFFKDVMKTETAYFNYYPLFHTEENYSYTFTEDELINLKEILHKASIDRTKDSNKASFTYQIDLFDRHGDYVFVIAMDSDRETIYVEDGMVESNELKLFINEMIDELETTVWNSALR